jgi:single-strand DNA-binding protein
LRTTQGGVSVATFTVAVDRDFQQGGEKKVDFFDVIAWNASAKFISQHFGKGDGIIIVGRLQSREYTDSDGKNRKITEIVAEKTEFAGGNRNDNRNNMTESAASGDVPFDV